jgi:antibiotic biosynthesis monooxygenase (ABM) superfamily enzyme
MSAASVVTTAQPVTVVVTRDVEPGREEEIHSWMHRLIVAGERFPGNLGVTILVPGAEAPGRRTVVYRWASESARRAWEESASIQRLLREADAFSIRLSQRATGLETWFTLPDVPGRVPPPRWKMYLVTLLTVYGLSLVMIPALSPWLEPWPAPVAQAVVAVLLTTLLTFVLLPLLTRLLRAWLYPTPSRPRPEREHQKAPPARTSV